MKIRNTDNRYGPKEKKDEDGPSHNWDKGERYGYDEPIPMREPEKTKYSMRKRDREGTVGRKGFNWEQKQSRKVATLYEAAPHTIWIRKDIWAALQIFKEEEHRSLRSCVEEALYRFLITENRVQGADDLGENPRNTSWEK